MPDSDKNPDRTGLTQAQEQRRPLFLLAEKLADVRTCTATELHQTYRQLQTELMEQLHSATAKLEPALRDYDPVLANCLEDSSLRLTTLLQQLLPRFAALAAGAGTAERYRLYQDWNLVLAEYLVHWDLVRRLEKQELEYRRPVLDTAQGIDLFAHCRKRVRRYCAQV